MSTGRHIRKKREGVVVKNAMDKTIVVKVTRLMQHPRFRKIVKMQKKYYAHDEKNQAAVGDKVIIVESKPVSKMKRWRLLKVVTS